MSFLGGSKLLAHSLQQSPSSGKIVPRLLDAFAFSRGQDPKAKSWLQKNLRAS